MLHRRAIMRATAVFGERDIALKGWSLDRSSWRGWLCLRLTVFLLPVVALSRRSCAGRGCRAGDGVALRHDRSAVTLVAVASIPGLPVSSLVVLFFNVPFFSVVIFNVGILLLRTSSSFCLDHDPSIRLLLDDLGITQAGVVVLSTCRACWSFSGASRLALSAGQASISIVSVGAVRMSASPSCASCTLQRGTVTEATITTRPHCCRILGRALTQH